MLYKWRCFCDHFKPKNYQTPWGLYVPIPFLYVFVFLKWRLSLWLQLTIMPRVMVCKFYHCKCCMYTLIQYSFSFLRTHHHQKKPNQGKLKLIKSLLFLKHVPWNFLKRMAKAEKSLHLSLSIHFTLTYFVVLLPPLSLSCILTLIIIF